MKDIDWTLAHLPQIIQPGTHHLPHQTSLDFLITETIERTFNPTQLRHKETVFTLSNGYLGTRGSFEEGYPGSCPATLINGVYDDAPIVATELANCPDWLPLVIIVGGDRFRLEQGEVLSYQRSLDLYRGILNRYIHWRSPSGYTFEFRFERFVSLADQHVLALRCQVTSNDYSGEVEVHAGLNGYSDNDGMLHWDCRDQAGNQDSVWLQVCSRRSKIELGMAAQLKVLGAESVSSQSISFQGYPTLVTRFQMQVGQEVTLEKVVTVFTSRETQTPVRAALDKLADLPEYPIVLAAHEAAWAKVWQVNDVVIEGDTTAQLAVRYNLFQLLSVAPRQDDRVSIPAKTLSGFAYRGHIFWDTEIFLLPCLTFTQPALARNLLTYRYHMLDGARRKAKQAGYEGAMYVWESASTGDEVTPTWVPDSAGKELVRIWCGEKEVHISTDIAYAIWHYWQATGDDDWMQAYGAEIVLDTAAFWGSRVEWKADQNRYEILDVIGPDEYHERVDNNAFTNCMAQWHLQTALTVLNWLRQYYPDRATALETQLNLTEPRIAHWNAIIQQLWIPQDQTRGLIEQFAGFFDLEDIDLADYEPRSRSMQSILGIEGANQRQVLKQADVLMLLYLLRGALFSQENSHWLSDRQTLQANWDYYVPRTDHTYGSSLGPPVHAILACDLEQPELAYEHFMRAALVDLSDVRGNAHEGIHAASTGGVWQAVVFGFGGIQLTAGKPIAKPQLPPGWKRLKFNLVWQGELYEFDLHAEPAQVKAQPLPEIQGVIFDLDGVLTDTSEFHFLGWKRLADEEGIAFDREANENLRGVSRRDSLRYLLQGREVTDEQFQEMMDRKNRYYLELIRTITPEHLLPGVQELLYELRAAGIKVAIGSASKNAQEVAQRLGITDLVHAIADGHSVANSKPAPDVFLFAAAQLGLAPESCVVVEDATSGIEAALRAGMRAIGLGPAERVGAAHLVYPNLANAHWTELRDNLINDRPSL
jgi:beta-phosphoglucomutase